jgi:hypothetical protein
VNIARIFFASAAVTCLAAVGILTGRRKFLVYILIFVISYFGLYIFITRQGRAARAPLTIAGLTAFLFLLVYDEVEPNVYLAPETYGQNAFYQIYLDRTGTVFGDMQNRFLQLGLAPFLWAYNWFGLLGGGAGIGTQGVQNFGVAGEYIGAAEGGIGKIMLELGLPGLLTVGALALALFRYVFVLLKLVGSISGVASRLACGMAALLIANFANFSVATQVFGDIFVLLLLGFFAATLFAVPTIFKRGSRETSTAFRQTL